MQDLKQIVQQDYDQQHHTIESYQTNYDQFTYESQNQISENKNSQNYYLQQFISNINSEIKKKLKESDILPKYQENKTRIDKKLSDEGYKLNNIIDGGGSSILISASNSQHQNLAIKIVEYKVNQDEIINNEKKIYQKLKEGKKGKYFAGLIAHLRLFDNWDAFIFQNYQSLWQEYNNYSEGKTFTEQSFLTYVFDLIHGLIELRRASIIHLDIKIENILINEQGNLLYCDFGISEIKNNEQKIKARGFSEIYSPDEQIKSDYVDFESDIYSLGKTLEFLIIMFIEKNHQSQLIPFAEGLLKIINDQMIRVDIKQRSNCYKVHYQFYQLFEEIPQRFVSQQSKYFEELKNEIKSFIELYVIDLFQDSLFEELNKQQKIISMLAQNSNYDFILKLPKYKESIHIYISENFLDQKELIIKNELSKFQKQSQKYKSHLNESLQKLISQDDKEKEAQTQSHLQDINKIQQYLSSFQVDEIIKIFDDTKVSLKKELIQDLQNSVLDDLLKLTDQNKIINQNQTIKSINEFNKFLIDHQVIDIANYLKELKSKQAVDISYILKDYSIEDLQCLQNNYMEQQSSKKISITYENAIDMAKFSINIIEQFYQVINGLKINDNLQLPQIQQNEFSLKKALEKYQDLVNFNQIGYEEIKYIKNSLSKCRNITELNL
ncbi:hypothetical protein ABPG73_006393 [Tetrahymena malaccensis]